MSLDGKAKRVRIYVNQGDLVGHRPSFVAVLEFLRKENAAGATVFRASEGFGGTGEVHTERLVDVMGGLPVVVEWIDSAERVDRLLDRIKQMVGRGLITVEDTSVVLYAPHGVRRVSPRLTAEDVMSRDVASVSPDASVRDVVELMRGQIYRAVPVVDHDMPTGIITNSDLVDRGGLSVRLELLSALTTPELESELSRLGGSAKTANDVMTRPLIAVHASTPLTEVADLMVHRHLKRLPVIDDDGKLAGMISRLDLLRTVSDGFAGDETESRDVGLNGSVPVSRIMRRDIPSVYPETPVAEVMQAVVSTRLNRVLVIDRNRKLLGLITDSELLERVTPSVRPNAIQSLMHRLPFVHHKHEQQVMDQHATAHTARDLMSSDVPAVFEGMPLREAVAPMLRGKAKLVAVVDNDLHFVGIVDRADVLRGLTEHAT